MRKTLVDTKAQRGLKAPVPQTYRCVWLKCCNTRRKFAHSSLKDKKQNHHNKKILEKTQDANMVLMIPYM